MCHFKPCDQLQAFLFSLVTLFFFHITDIKFIMWANSLYCVVTRALSLNADSSYFPVKTVCRQITWGSLSAAIYIFGHLCVICCHWFSSQFQEERFSQVVKLATYAHVGQENNKKNIKNVETRCTWPWNSPTCEPKCCQCCNSAFLWIQQNGFHCFLWVILLTLCLCYLLFWWNVWPVGFNATSRDKHKHCSWA